MRELFLFMMVSLDGYYEGPDHDISWHNVDEEFNEFAIQQTGAVGSLLFGRKTYELMASYWPTEAAKTDDPIVAGQMNSIPKLVFSGSLKQADWENSTLVNEDPAGVVTKLKEQPGGDLAIFGSSALAASLAGEGLIDEFRIMVNPVVLGSGKSLLEGVRERLQLKLVNTKTFRSGNVLLYYRPIKSQGAQK